MEKFDVKNVTENIITWIQEYFANQPHAKGAILGISGGKDSSVVAALLTKALGTDKVMGVFMPNGIQKDISDSYRLVDILGISHTCVDVGRTYDSMVLSLPDYITNQSEINIPPRIRMTVLYAIGSSMGYRVAGTGHKSEAYVGYFTKWGDGACDFNPIADLTTDEVILVGKELGLPNDLLEKPPSDGLCGKTDEDNLGFTYDELNQYIRTGVCDNEEVKKKIDKMHEYNTHKFNRIPYYKLEL